MAQAAEKPCTTEVCDTTLRCISVIDQHDLTTTGEQPFKTPKHDAVVGYPLILNKDKHINTRKAAQTSDVCDTEIRYSAMLDQDNQVNTGEKPYKPAVCDTASEEVPIEVNSDVVSNTPGLNQYNESDCLENPGTYENYGTFVALDYHYILNKQEPSCTGEKIYKCELCGKSFPRISGLNRHMQIHSTERPFKCGMCEKSFKRASHLAGHIKIHTRKKGVKCEIFGPNSNIALDVNPPTEEKQYKCEVCDKTFDQPSSLTEHKRIHASTGEKPYKCEVCENAAFTCFANLAIHMRIHTGEKPYKCEVCEKPFSRSQHLENHMRIHTGETPYKCEMCGKSFGRHSVLIKHWRTHTGEKCFKCDICEKSFGYSHNLTSHMRRHTGEKPYTCGHCDKCFSQSSSLAKHTRLLHPGNGNTNNQSSTVLPISSETRQSTEVQSDLQKQSLS